MGKYILSVSSAAVIVCVCCGFFDEKSSVGALVRMTGGILLAFVMLSPVAQWDYDAVAAFTQSYEMPGLAAAEQGRNMAARAVSEIISEETCAYILDKASDLGAEISVQVDVTSGCVPTPEYVRLEGPVSPYAKQQLQRIINEELGIPKERQRWIG